MAVREERGRGRLFIPCTKKRSNKMTSLHFHHNNHGNMTENPDVDWSTILSRTVSCKPICLGKE